MYYGNIKWTDIADGPGTRVALFVSGCTHKCKGCFNPETWDFKYGRKFDYDVETSIIDHCRPSYISGLTILGGEPMEPINQIPLVILLRRLRREVPGKTVWCYTGCMYEELKDKSSRYYTHYTKTLLSLIDVLVDGPFVQDLADISLVFKGSENQRIIDLRKTEGNGRIILWDD